LAGYSYADAEEVRRGIGKKNQEVLGKHGKILKDTLIEKRGWTKQQAETLFETIQASAKYSFNLSHSVSYAIIAYNGCWLKHHYPLEFWKGELSVHGSDEKKMSSYIRECGRFLEKIDIMRSDVSQWVIEDSQKLRPPLNFIKGCGAKGAKSIKDFILNANAKIEADSDDME
jgi:DNA polymerase-3 subunit alpha